MIPRVFAVLLLAQTVPLASAAPLRIESPDPGFQPSIVWSISTGYGTGEVTATGDALLFGSTNGTTRTDRPGDWTHILNPRVPLDEYDNAMICLDAKTGALRWRAVHPQVDRPAGFPGFGITSKPAVAGDRVYYLAVNWELVCADLEGFHDDENDGPFTDEKFKEEIDADIIWKIDLRKELGVNCRGAGDIGYVQSSPLVMDGLVYIVTGNGSIWNETRTVPAPDAPSFLAVDRFTGKVAWSSNAPGKNIVYIQGASPVAMLERNEVVFPGGDGCLYGFDAKSGKQHWKADLNAIGGTKELFFECRPIVTNGMVIASLREQIESGPQKGAPLIAVKPGKPGEAVETAWVFGKDLGGFWPQSLLQDGTVYVTSDPNFLHAIDPATGKERWHVTATGKPDGMGIQLGAGGGRLYLTNSDGDFTIVNPATMPPAVRTLELTMMPSAYAHPVLTPSGLFLPMCNGVFMVRMP